MHDKFSTEDQIRHPSITTAEQQVLSSNNSSSSSVAAAGQELNDKPKQKQDSSSHQSGMLDKRATTNKGNQDECCPAP